MGTDETRTDHPLVLGPVIHAPAGTLANTRLLTFEGILCLSEGTGQRGIRTGSQSWLEPLPSILL